MRALEFQSYSEVAAQREGFDKTRDYLHWSLDTLHMKNTVRTAMCTKSIKMKDPL